MYPIDSGTRSRIQPLLQRVLIVDPKLHTATVLGGCLKAFGCLDLSIESDHAAALAAARTLEPTLIVAEAQDDDDPFAMVRSIRRSSMACRTTPVFVLTTLATASAIKQAKDAGAHEFMRKPFAYRDLMRRLDHLAQHPRAWVEKPAYAGPDRRQFNSGAARRRLADRLELVNQGVSASSLYLVR
ncbi:MAG: response regulator [Brevundimonas sp.]|nr:MAG: response regulator [Brevundimonas sp.]